MSARKLESMESSSSTANFSISEKTENWFRAFLKESRREKKGRRKT